MTKFRVGRENVANHHMPIPVLERVDVVNAVVPLILFEAVLFVQVPEMEEAHGEKASGANDLMWNVRAVKTAAVAGLHKTKIPSK